MDEAARFWNRIAKKYAKRPVGDEAAYERKLEITRGFLTPETEVFEFGCGTGTTARRHAPYAKHILAIDISPAMLDIARTMAKAQGVGNVTFREAGIGDFNAPDASFDMVMAHSVLHLLAERDSAITKAFRLLKPGGIFVSSTTCMADGFGFMHPILPFGRMIGFFPYVSVFSSDELRAAIERVGFEIVEDWRPGKRKATFLVARKPSLAK